MIDPLSGSEKQVPQGAQSPDPDGNPPGLTEAQLVEKSKMGDHEAFRALVEDNSPRIFRLFRRLLGRLRDQAEDMTQEVFLRAWRGLPNYTADCAFSTWLYRIALNFWVQEHRRRTALKRSGKTYSINAPLLSKDSDFFIEPKSQVKSPLRLAHSKETLRAIQDAVAGLDQEMRTVVTLRDFQGCSYEEIASILSIPIGTVRSRLHRARARLQEVLQSYL